MRDAHQLYRSDFFPGLGWMLRNELWQELKCVPSKTQWSPILPTRKLPSGNIAAVL